MRAPSVSVVTPACSSATSFTRHTSFATSPPSFREPGAYSRRDQPPRVCMLSSWQHRLMARPRPDLVHLRRIDPDRGMWRFYSLALQPTLLGGVDLVGPTPLGRA